MKNNNFLIYGATGYTGKLTLQIASQLNLKPVIAGRNEAKLATLANKYNLNYFTFDVNDSEKLENILSDFPLVLNCAGPFVNTASQFINACLKTKTHYIDITGEIVVFELAKKLNGLAKQNNIMLMPGVGFDVVPTDSLSLFLKNKITNPTHLKIAFATIGGRISHGTATTMLNGLGDKGVVRKNGKLERVPIGHKQMTIDFGITKIFAMTIPWGDISTAYTTTGIENIETYFGTSKFNYTILQFQNLFNWILRIKFVKSILQNRINNNPEGPSEIEIPNSKSLVWAEVKNAKGEIARAKLACPNSYLLTAYSSLIITKKILNGNFKTGYQTPAGCYGEDLVLEVPGVERKVIL